MSCIRKDDEQWFDKEEKENWKKEWLAYLKDAGAFLYDQMIETPELLQVMVKEKFLDLEDTRQLVLKANEQNTALILNYQHENFTEEEINNASSDDLTLDFNSDSYIKKYWKYEEMDNDSAMITGYFGSDTKVIVPNMIGRKRVRAIGKGAFSPDYNDDLPSVIKDLRRNIVEIIVPNCVTKNM